MRIKKKERGNFSRMLALSLRKEIGQELIEEAPWWHSG